jgi:hypothetical protein
MEFETCNNLEKFKDHPKLESLQIEEPKKRSPLILYDVDSLITAKELKENIVQQNMGDDFSTEEEDIILRLKIQK